MPKMSVTVSELLLLKTQSTPKELSDLIAPLFGQELYQSLQELNKLSSDIAHEQALSWGYSTPEEERINRKKEIIKLKKLLIEKKKLIEQNLLLIRKQLDDKKLTWEKQLLELGSTTSNASAGQGGNNSNTQQKLSVLRKLFELIGTLNVQQLANLIELVNVANVFDSKRLANIQKFYKDINESTLKHIDMLELLNFMNFIPMYHHAENPTYMYSELSESSSEQAERLKAESLEAKEQYSLTYLIRKILHNNEYTMLSSIMAETKAGLDKAKDEHAKKDAKDKKNAQDAKEFFEEEAALINKIFNFKCAITILAEIAKNPFTDELQEKYPFLEKILDGIYQQDTSPDKRHYKWQFDVAVEAIVNYCVKLKINTFDGFFNVLIKQEKNWSDKSEFMAKLEGIMQAILSANGIQLWNPDYEYNEASKTKRLEDVRVLLFHGKKSWDCGYKDAAEMFRMNEVTVELHKTKENPSAIECSHAFRKKHRRCYDWHVINARNSTYTLLVDTMARMSAQIKGNSAALSAASIVAVAAVEPNVAVKVNPGITLTVADTAVSVTRSIPYQLNDENYKKYEEVQSRAIRLIRGELISAAKHSKEASEDEARTKALLDFNDVTGFFQNLASSAFADEIQEKYNILGKILDAFYGLDYSFDKRYYKFAFHEATRAIFKSCVKDEKNTYSIFFKAIIEQKKNWANNSAEFKTTLEAIQSSILAQSGNTPWDCSYNFQAEIELYQRWGDQLRKTTNDEISKEILDREFRKEYGRPYRYVMFENRDATYKMLENALAKNKVHSEAFVSLAAATAAPNTPVVYSAAGIAAVTLVVAVGAGSPVANGNVTTAADATDSKVNRPNSSL